MAFRPTIARGLALSLLFSNLFLALDKSKRRAIHLITRYSILMSCYIRELGVTSQSAKKFLRTWVGIPIWYGHLRKPYSLDRLKN